MFLLQLHQMGCCKVLQVLDFFDKGIGLLKQSFAVFTLTLFTDDQKGRPFDLKIGLTDSIGYKRGFPAVKKTVDNIDWFLFHFFFSF